MLEFIGAVVFGYLIGSIPTAYIIARFLKGIDIRAVGSGNVGGSNVAVQVGKFPAAAVLLFDIVKGALAIAILRGIGVSDAAQMAAGIAAIIGHSWPVWLRFVGGRGISTTGGVLFMFGPVETIVAGIVLGLSGIVHTGAIMTVVVFALWPLAAWLLGSPTYVVAGSAIIWLIIVARRLQGSPGVTHTVAGEPVLWNRFWLDRDIRDAEEWVKQKAIKSQ